MGGLGCQMSLSDRVKSLWKGILKSVVQISGVWERETIKSSKSSNKNPITEMFGQHDLLIWASMGRHGLALKD